MSETEQGSGTPTVESGAPDSNSEPTKESKQVSVEELEQIKKDMFRYKTEAKTLKAQLEETKKTELKQKEEFKTLWEQEQQAHTKLKESVVRHEKLSAVYAAALKSGLRQEAESDLRLLQLDGVELDSNGDQFLVTGADEYVENLKKTRPHWFKSSDVPRFNSNGATTAAPQGQQKLTVEKMLELKRTNYKKYLELLPQYTKLKAQA